MKYVLVSILLMAIMSCGSQGGHQNVGYLGLTFQEEQEFDPNLDHGRIDNFKIIIQGDTLNADIVKYYSGSTKSIQLDGLEANSKINITVEAINENGFVIRRGYAENIEITANAVSEAVVSIFNVPIFTNIKPEGYINLNRFVPRVFAPGEITFQISDTFGAATTSLSDQVTENVTMSISEEQFPNQMAPVYISKLQAGEHGFQIRDPDTGESTEINFIGYQPPATQGLVTTSGAYLGLMMNSTLNGRIY